MNILMLPGDGIGPEIAAATQRVLKSVDRVFALGLALNEAPVGLRSLRKTGTTFPEWVATLAAESDGVILGPLASVDYPSWQDGGIDPAAELRRRFELYADIRPARARAGLPCAAPDLDVVIVRDDTEGLSGDRSMASGGAEFMPDADMALSIRKVTRKGTSRIARMAAEVARVRGGRLTVVHRANVLRVSDGLFCEVVRETVADYPGLAVEERLMDSVCNDLILTPGRFDVLVTSSLFGDILASIGAALSGGPGLAAALNVGDRQAMAHPGHGAAPDIVGRDVANPAGLIQAAAMLLRWFGQRRAEPGFVTAADAVQASVDALVGTPEGRTRDLGGDLSTQAFAEAVTARLERG